MPFCPGLIVHPAPQPGLPGFHVVDTILPVRPERDISADEPDRALDLSLPGLSIISAEISGDDHDGSPGPRVG